MTDINTVTISGRLTKDVELKTTNGGVSIARLSIASNHSKKDSSGTWHDVTGFFDVTVWRGQAEYLKNNAGKGDQLILSGALRWSSWEGTDGKKQSRVEIAAETVILKKKGEKGSEPQGDPQAAAVFDSGARFPDDFPF